MKSILIVAIITLGILSKEYQKEYYDNGKIKAKGWAENNKKQGYWYHYFETGNLNAEGSYNYGKKNKWWVFYNEKQEVVHKCQLKNGVKNGYCLMYKMNKLNSAKKFSNGKKVNEWFDFSSFKKENKLSDLK